MTKAEREKWLAAALRKIESMTKEELIASLEKYGLTEDDVDEAE